MMQVGAMAGKVREAPIDCEEHLVSDCVERRFECSIRDVYVFIRKS